jgi:hypothetical protein
LNPRRTPAITREYLNVVRNCRREYETFKIGHLNLKIYNMKNLLLLLLTTVTITVYSQKAKIDCPPKTKLRKDVSLGYLNYRGAQLGEIYTVKLAGTKIKSMTPLAQKGVDATNIETSAITALKQHKTKIDFTLDASADMSPALKAELKSELNKEMNFRLFNSRTKMVKDPLLQIAYFDPNIFPIKSGEVYAFINRVTISDSLVVTTETGLDIDASAKVKVGDYDVEIVNNCNGLLLIKGLQVPAFFELRVFQASVSTTTKSVVGILKSNEAKTVKVKEVKWTELTGIELEDDPQD